MQSAVSFGEPLPRRVVRGIVLSRLTNFIEGHSGVTPGLAEAVAAMLDGRPLPDVPRHGNGGSGEIPALGALFGSVGAERQLQLKESMSLINGSPCASALTADASPVRGRPDRLGAAAVRSRRGGAGRFRGNIRRPARRALG